LQLSGGKRFGGSGSVTNSSRDASGKNGAAARSAFAAGDVVAARCEIVRLIGGRFGIAGEVIAALRGRLTRKVR